MTVTKEETERLAEAEKKGTKEHFEKRKREVEQDQAALESSTMGQLNLVFMVQAFLFVAETVIASTVQSPDSRADVKLAVATLFLALPLLGIVLSVLSGFLLNPLFKLHENYGVLRLDYLQYRNEAEATALRQENAWKQARQSRIHQVYRLILVSVFAVWLAVLLCSVVDYWGMSSDSMSPSEAPTYLRSASPSTASPSTATPTP